MATLAEMESRAQRHLDGIKVNVDAMAKDVLLLVKSVRAAQKAPDNVSKPVDNPFPDFFDQIWG